MATMHAEPGEIVNLSTWADDLPEEHSKAIVKTEEMELARLLLQPGETIGRHHVNGPLIIHCLSGSLEIVALGETRDVSEGELLYLPPGENFSLNARRRTSVLVTFIFTK